MRVKSRGSIASSHHIVRLVEAEWVRRWGGMLRVAPERVVPFRSWTNIASFRKQYEEKTNSGIKIDVFDMVSRKTTRPILIYEQAVWHAPSRSFEGEERCRIKIA